MGAHRNELADLHALLSTLQHQPFGGARQPWPAAHAQPRACMHVHGRAGLCRLTLALPANLHPLPPPLPLRRAQTPPPSAA